MKIDWRPSFELLAVTFLTLGLLYFGCFFPAFGYDEGTNPDGELSYRIISLISAPLSFLNSYVAGWTPFFLIILLDLIIWAILISLLLRITLSVLSKSKKTN